MRQSIKPGQPDTPVIGPESGRALRAAVERELGEFHFRRAGQPLPSISDHELLQVIGGGAYGEVWLARNVLGTLRAVKIVYRACFDEERPFQREFQGILKYEPISRTHAGLMQIMHVGRNDSAGFFYYVMELADEVDAASDGGSARSGPASLDQRPSTFRPRTLRSEQAKGLRLPPLEAARLTLKLANALAHLHAHGLVHRDIKPANVIFVGGQPKLADIGLVTSVGDARSFVGTEGFIPPEGPGTAHADVYSLGKLLYELATGRDRLDFPQLPADLMESPESEALLDLNEVITRACAPEARHRYASAGQLQADLQTFLAGYSLRTARRIERHLAWLKVLAIGALLFLVFGGLAIWVAKINERKALQQARTEAALRIRAETAERAFQRELYNALLARARAGISSHEVGQRNDSLDALRRAAAITNSPELRQVVMAALALPDLQFKRELPFIGREYRVSALDPAFERIALCKGKGPVEIRAAADQRLLATLAGNTNLLANVARWSPDGTFLAIKRDRSPGGDQSSLEVWNVTKLQCVLSVPDSANGVCCFHPRLPRLLATCGGGAAAVWDLENGRQLARFMLEEDPLCLAMSPEGSRFAAPSKTKAGGAVSVYALEDGALLSSAPASVVVASLDWHPAGRWLGVADQSGAIYLLDSRTGRQQPLGRHKVQAVTTLFSPDGRYLLSGGWERELILWDIHRMERALTIRLGGFSAQFKNDGSECALATSSPLQIYRFELPACHREFEEDLGGRVHCAALSADGKWLAACGLGRLGVWDLAQPGPGAMAAEGADARLYFAPNDELFASKDKKALRWRPAAAASPDLAPVLAPMPIGVPDGFSSLCVVSNQLAWTTADGTRLSGPDGLPSSAGAPGPAGRGINGASPDGRWLAVYQSFTPLLHIYRLPAMEPVFTITNKEDIGGFVFSPTSEELAVTSHETARLWSTRDWKLLREIAHCKDILYCPRESQVWLTRDFGEAGLYDSRTLELLAPLPGGWLPLALSPDGQQLAVSVEAQRLELWNLQQLRAQWRALGMDWRPGLK